MPKNRILFALVAVALAVLPALAAADEARTVVWLTQERTPSDAVRLEAEAAGYTLVVSDAPSGTDGGARLANARALGRVLGAAFTVFVEMEGTPTVFVIAADGTIAHAPLSNTRFSQRALALVAMSLVEELGDRAAPAVAEAPAVTADVAVATAPEAAPPAAAPEQAAPAQTAPVEAAPAPETAATPEETGPALPVLVHDTAQDIRPPTVVVVDAPPGSEVLIDVHPQDMPERVVRFGGDIVPFLGTSMLTRGQATRRISLNLFVGFDGGLDGFELGGIANIHRRNVHGLQIAGAVNGNGGTMRGMQISGVANYAGGDVLGVQASMLNIARERMSGLQLGMGNYAGGDVLGAQAGNVNLARGRMAGAQLGMLNVARGDVTGVQAGMLNIARADVSGAQLGMANYTNGHGGVQLGLVNISRDADFALGLINIVRDGRTQLEILGNDGGFAFAGVKHGGRHFHSIYSLGINAFETDPIFAAGLGFGLRATSQGRVHVDFDAVAHVLVDKETDDGNGNVETLTSARVLVGIRIVEGLSLVLGASYDTLFTPTTRDRTNGFGTIDATRLTTDTEGWDSFGWPSLMFGIQVL